MLLLKGDYNHKTQTPSDAKVPYMPDVALVHKHSMAHHNKDCYVDP